MPEIPQEAVEAAARRRFYTLPKETPSEEREGQVTVTLSRDSAKKLLDDFPTVLLHICTDEQKELRDGLEAALNSTTHNPEEG